MKNASLFSIAFLFLAGMAFAVEELKWREILGPPQKGKVEVSLQPVKWRANFPAALREAKSTGKPMLVTFRCLPCKQCADFDKNVLEGSARLTPLLKEFITVRLTDAAQLDERYFPFRGYQDLDLSWWGYFLSPEGRLYGVFGGKDHVSESTRISEAALVKSLERVLAHHRDPRRAKWDVDGPLPDQGKPESGPRKVESFEKLKVKKPYLTQQACLHCHQVNDVLHFDAMEKGEFDLKKYTQAWPLPENAGIEVDRDEGLLVTKVAPGSAAEKAGLRSGDILGMAGGVRLFGQADFRGALHRASFGDAEVEIAWTRGGEVMFGSLKLVDGWRAGENWWRKSVYEGIYGPHFGFFPLAGPKNGKGSMSFRPFMGNAQKRTENRWWSAGLRPSMEIVEINGRRDDWNTRQLIAWFRLNHQPGDEVKLVVKDGKGTREIVMVIPKE